jgi:hypothetical protein
MLRIALLACFGLSLAAGIMAMGAFLVAGEVLWTPLNWKQAFLVCPLVFVAGTLPMSPAFPPQSQRLHGPDNVSHAVEGWPRYT